MSDEKKLKFKFMTPKRFSWAFAILAVIILLIRIKLINCSPILECVKDLCEWEIVAYLCGLAAVLFISIPLAANASDKTLKCCLKISMFLSFLAILFSTLPDLKLNGFTQVFSTIGLLLAPLIWDRKDLDDK